jgi:hypothetical protein
MTMSSLAPLARLPAGEAVTVAIGCTAERGPFLGPIVRWDGRTGHRRWCSPSWLALSCGVSAVPYR